MRRVIDLQAYEPSSETFQEVIVVAIQKIIDSGSTLLVTPTAIQNILHNTLTGIEFGSQSIPSVVKFIHQRKTVALPPSTVSHGMRINSWENIIFLGNNFSLKPKNQERDIHPMTPADNALANSLALRIDDINSKITIFDIPTTITRIEKAIDIWRENHPVYAEIESRVLELV